MSVQISTSRELSPGEGSPAAGSDLGRVRLAREGVLLGNELVPLLSGSVHYWRLEPESWRSCLEALRDMGATLVDIYVPWGAHEKEDGVLDFGELDPSLDVKRFLRIASELGLYALVRPGPHINAELSGFGLPERVLWESEYQARSPGGEPVVLPMPPHAFPIPSYASHAFLDEARTWLRRVAEELGPMAWPKGPIVMCQVDNEGALYFRDGVYEQDYHRDSLALYRMRLEQRYGTPARMAEAYGLALDSFDIAPPQRFDAKDARGLAWHLDWAEHQEATIADAFAKFRAALSYAGLERVPTCHNLPMGESATPLDPARLGKVVECLGMDYYHVASESSADAIFRRTTEVAARADAFEYPAFAIELAAGFPPFFPPLTEQDNRFAALACLAAGIRGFNLYMAVERDRWIGSPIDRFGKARPSFDFWQRLNEAVRRTRLPELSRMADVCVIVPRSMHRLERMLHAFGPMSAAAFDVMGLGAYDSCLEQGPFASSLFEAESFLRQLLGALNQQGIAYRVAGNDAAATALAQSRFGYVTAASGLEPELWQVLGEVAERGTPLYFGPALPRTAPDAVTALPPLPPAAAPQCEAVSAIGVSASLAAALRAHGAFQLAAGRGLRNSVFRDQGGVPRVLFILNTTNTPQIAKLDAPFLSSAVDALDGDSFHATVGALEVPLSPQSVRMLELKA